MSEIIKVGSFLRPSSHEITNIRDVLQGMSWSQEVRLERQLFPSYFLDCLGFQWHSQINSGCNRHSKVYRFMSWFKIYDLSIQHPSLDTTFTSKDTAHIDSIMDKQFCWVEWKLVLTSRLCVCFYIIKCVWLYNLYDLQVCPPPALCISA